jgi:hypothetical protein
MSLQQILWGGCAAAAGLAAYASWADRRSLRRSDPDAVSLVPWPLVIVMSVLASAVLCAIALKTG